jgi:signal transduction histidine kinase
MDHSPTDCPTERDLQLAGLIHDLNNVFQTIVEAADLLSYDPKWASLSNTIVRSVERGKGITGSLDDTTRSADFEAILHRAIQFTEDLRNFTQSPHVDFHRQIEPGLRFRGRALAMERVLVNLLVNGARAATSSGTPGDLRIRAFTDIEDLCVMVCDSGPGIEPRILPLIFEPGFSTRSQSSGLGLHIVRSIVGEHGGTVTASNLDGSAGACFTIRIPLRGPENTNWERPSPAWRIGETPPVASAETPEPLPGGIDLQRTATELTAPPDHPGPIT